MAKGKKVEFKKPEIKKEYSGWTTTAIILKGLMTPYRLSGKIGDTIEVPNDLVDELVKAKKIKLV